MKQCIQCNKELKKENYRDKSTYQRARFCDNACYQAYHAIKLKTKICPICEKSFQVNRFRKLTPKTCSTKCSYEYRKSYGHKYITLQGYIAIKTHSEFAFPDGYELEHRYVMRLHLKRPLTTNEQVHHKDGNKTNNEISNLVLLTNSEHQILHKSAEKLNTKEAIQQRIITRYWTKP